MKSKRLGASSEGRCTAHHLAHPPGRQEVFGGMGEQTKAALFHVVSQALDHRVFSVPLRVALCTYQ